jgi:uncharacterized protein YyaL (SSP411 family)
MQHESFSSPDVAAILNTFFIPVKVDREVRPDIDEIYMNYVNATTGSGGWPLNVFLTPDLDPVFGGTYWPGPGSSPLQRISNNSEDAPLSFLDILIKMRDIWITQQDRCSHTAKFSTQQLREFAAEGTHSQPQSKAAETPTLTPEPLDLDLLDDALTHFISRYDRINSGFSTPSSPKFPTPPNLSFLLRIGASITTTSTRFGFPSPVPPILGKSACTNAANMALHTLLTISRSALRDHLGHGFHRYSVTPDWNLPHFEKMLPDNAQLLSVYCDAWALSRNPEILGTIYSLVEYFTNPESPIVSRDGAFYSSEDADSRPSKSPSDSQRKEGAYYVWTLRRLSTVLGNERDAAVLARHFGVNADGNVPAEHDTNDEFLTQNVLHITATPSVLAREFGMPEEEIVKTIKAGKKRLAEWRQRERERPAVDEKIVAGWNGLAISALCRASNTLAGIDEGRSKRCREAALRSAAFVREKMWNEEDGSLKRFTSSRSSQNGDDSVAYVDDYAYLAASCLALFDMTFDKSYLHWAERMQEYLDKHFRDEVAGGYFQVPSTTGSPSQHIVRLKPGTDTALPSPNGTIAMNSLYLSSYLNDTEGRHIKAARQTMGAFAVEVIQHPFLFVTMVGAVVLECVGVKNIQVEGEISEAEIRSLNGWGRTLVKLPSSGAKKVLLCENGVCREMVEGELDKMDYDEDGK